MEQLEHSIKLLQDRQQQDFQSTNKKIADFIVDVDAKLDSQMHAISDALAQTQKFLAQVHLQANELFTSLVYQHND